VGIAVCRGHAGAGGASSGRENRSTAADRAPGWLYGIGWGAVFGGYFFSGLRCGLQKFGELSKPHGAALAAVGGQRSWPSPSSISRLLAALEPQQSERFSQWLLGEALPMPGVARHRAAHGYERFGQGWELFDWDSTCTVLRQRALPAAEDLPEPKRRARELAAPGYPGRKRGEVQLGRATLQHSGTSQWLGLWCVPGNAPRLEQTRQAALAVRQYCARYGLDPQGALLRCDGQAAAGVRSLLACQEAGIHSLTRLSRYELLEWPQVQQALEQGRFEPVAEALSGPRREAAELGSLALCAKQLQDGQSERPSLRSRIVISRFAAGQSKRGAGLVRGPWQYELYGTSLEQSSWPAAETVAAYYGRCAQENRFFQEDSEAGAGSDLQLPFGRPASGVRHRAVLLDRASWARRPVLWARVEAQRCGARSASCARTASGPAAAGSGASSSSEPPAAGSGASSSSKPAAPEAAPLQV